MVEPHGHDEPMTAFLVVRLWWDEQGQPALRARVRSVLEEPTGVARTVVVAGRGPVLEVLGQLLDEFEQVARRRTDCD
jgi:hypothetical protein